MAQLLLSFAVILLSVLGMSVGVVCGRRPLRNGCGEAGPLACAGERCAACGRGTGEEHEDGAGT